MVVFCLSHHTIAKKRVVGFSHALSTHELCTCIGYHYFVSFSHGFTPLPNSERPTFGVLEYRRRERSMRAVALLFCVPWQRSRAPHRFLSLTWNVQPVWYRSDVVMAHGQKNEYPKNAYKKHNCGRMNPYTTKQALRRRVYATDDRKHDERIF